MLTLSTQIDKAAAIVESTSSRKRDPFIMFRWEQSF
jgi:hypothetical protein